MHAACLVAEYKSHAAAKIGIEVLGKFDFHADAISVAWRGNEQALQKLDRPDDKNAELDAGESMGGGAAIAALAGIPLGAATLIGPMMVVGPLAAIAVGAAVGGTLAAVSDDISSNTRADRVDSRGLFAMANHLGISDHDASNYEERIRDGAVLVIVVSTPPRLDEAQAGLKTTGPVSLQRFAFQDTKSQ